MKAQNLTAEYSDLKIGGDELLRGASDLLLQQ